jgi:hypothetical protein
MRWWPFAAAISAMLLPGADAGAMAQAVVVSPRAERVAVTVYRDPDRSADHPLRTGWYGGYAMISETRQIALPAGESVIRFEGVAAGMIPQSVIVSGFPDGIVERNRDADLLSPATLLDRAFGRRVMIRRTSRATGAVEEVEAVIRSSAAGAVVLQTAQGFEALRCTGLSEALIYDRIPAGLSPQPTLSVRARATQAVTATVTLTYLASGFDWRANYIARLSADGRRIDLFAWLTLGSSDETSFPNADTQAVAGQPNRERNQFQPRTGGPLNLRCYGEGARPEGGEEGDIVVTGSRVRSAERRANFVPEAAVTAEQEDLGDLKLYRIPEPVTIAANSQKQVALLTQPNVRVDIVWRTELTEQEPGPLESLLTVRTRNRRDRGLGLPLPAGGVTLFREYQGRPVLIGDASIEDRALEEKVEMNFPAPPSLSATLEVLEEDGDAVAWRLVVSNAADHAVDYEGLLPEPNYGQYRYSRRVRREDGRWIWRTRIPANGSASIEWAAAEQDD